MGVLTQFLHNKNINLKVIEIDIESIFYLRLHYPKLDIIEGDFLDLDLEEVTKNKLSLIGNFPYNISSQILFKVFENRDKITEVVGMFQKKLLKELSRLKGRKKEF